MLFIYSLNTQLPAGPAVVPFPAETLILLSASYTPLQDRGAQRIHAKLAFGRTAMLG